MQLACQRQEALDEHLAIDRIALIEVACEERAILLGAAIAHADSPVGTPDGGALTPRSAAAGDLISFFRRAAALTETIECERVRLLSSVALRAAHRFADLGIGVHCRYKRQLLVKPA